jgi:hypothetical protein
VTGQARPTDGGQVVITRFECPDLLRLVLVVILHLRLKLDVRRQATGYLGGTLLVQWRRRCLLSVSVWHDRDSLHSMGSVPRHVQAARLPGRLGIATACGVYSFAGDWRQVMFGRQTPPRSPLRPLHP